MDRQRITPAQQATIAEEVRKGINSELRVKKIDTEVTKTGYTTLCTSANGTRMDNRRSIDRGTNGVLGSQDYGSVMTPASPIKQGMSLAQKAALGGTEVKAFNVRRNTMAKATRGHAYGAPEMEVKRSNSVQRQNAPSAINTMMARTAPQGFF